MRAAPAGFPGAMAITDWNGACALVFDIPGGVEVICADEGVLRLIRDVLAGQARGPLLPVAEMDRVYFPGIGLAHLVDRAPLVPAIFCDPDVNARDLPGTGSQEETDWAADLDLCRACVRKAAIRRVLS